ncbi:Nif3-like dinuclear metal center hexameric protein [Magnetovirga frankeli]|uniref:Nif3-like dinuclear metal center hexameric protein n=1 Tax=Magnetovirga frankeli TaxID=947516 RepID=UPI00129346BC|nr:Nif3-like dinuclear metal center hexameric protein [gamma proteobacterium SS-5]
MPNLYEIERYCNTLLQVQAFSDYCPNGLQVDAGAVEIKRLATAVSASQAVIEQALRWQAELLLVHHGYFWKNEAQPLVGIKGRRVRQLMQGGLSLLAYHLPLDAHVGLGNNAELGRRLGLEGRPLEEHGLLWIADLETPLGVGKFTQRLDLALGRTPLRFTAKGEIQRVAWCTGAAQGYIEQAAAAGAQAYISGEVSEPTYHLAAELGLHYFAAGHHATERYGVQALGHHLAEEFGLEMTFLDQNNPA